MTHPKPFPPHQLPEELERFDGIARARANDLCRAALALGLQPLGAFAAVLCEDPSAPVLRLLSLGEADTIGHPHRVPARTWQRLLETTGRDFARSINEAACLHSSDPEASVITLGGEEVAGVILWHDEPDDFAALKAARSVADHDDHCAVERDELAPDEWEGRWWTATIERGKFWREASDSGDIAWHLRREGDERKGADNSEPQPATYVRLGKVQC